MKNISTMLSILIMISTAIFPLISNASELTTFSSGAGQAEFSYATGGAWNDTLNISIPKNSKVLGATVNVTGLPVYENHSLTHTTTSDFMAMGVRSNVTVGNGNVSLADFGSWWEETAIDAWGRRSSNASLIQNLILAGDVLVLRNESQPPYVPDENTIGLWHFDEGSGTTTADSSNSKNNGTLTGCQWVSGKYGNALSFNGTSDYVSMGTNTAAFNESSNFTIDVCVKFNQIITEDNAEQYIVTRGCGNNHGFTLCQGKNVGEQVFIFYMKNGTGSASPYYVNGKVPYNFSIGQWYSIRVCRIGTINANVTIYINSTEVGSFTQSGLCNPGDSDIDFRVGAEYTGPGTRHYNLNGSVDELRISNIVRGNTSGYSKSPAVLLSPILNVSAYSRIVVQGDFPNCTNYTVDILDPANNNATLQSGLKNGDELDLAIWSGQPNNYRGLVARLNVNTTNSTITPVISKWGIGTACLFTDNSLAASSQQLLTANSGIRLKSALDPINWIKYPDNPLINNGTSAWDGQAVNYPNVIKEDNGYKMWFSGQKTDYGLGYATSSDGYKWTLYPGNPILTKSSGQWDGTGIMGGMSVIKDGSTYKMWYAGTQSLGGPNNIQIGYATSPDGFTWTKYAGNPVFNCSSSSGDWDWYRVHSPTVIKIDNEYKMWYVGLNQGGGTMKIGFANSTDGINWVKYASNPIMTVNTSGYWDSYGLDRPYVIKDSNGYKMWFSGSTGSKEKIGYATSTDGLSWTKYANNPILVRPAQAWETNQYKCAFVLTEEDSYRIYYNGYDGTNGRIGSATSRPDYPNQGYFVTSSLEPFGDQYGNLVINATTSLISDYYVNVTDENNITLISEIHNGDPITINASDYPRIRFNISLWTNDSLHTPIIHEWGYGLAVDAQPADYKSIAIISNSTATDLIRLAYDKGAWSQKSDMSQGRGQHLAEIDPETKVMYVQGGWTSNSSKETYAYDIQNDTWKFLVDGPPMRYSPASVWNPVTRQVMMFGGWITHFINESWAYTPSINKWTRLADMPAELTSSSAVWDSVFERVLVYGGEDEWNGSKHFFAYHPQNDTWEILPDGPYNVGHHSAVFNPVTGAMIISGGGPLSMGTAFGNTSAYYVMNKTWVNLTPQPIPRGNALTGFSLKEQKMYVAYGVTVPVTYFRDIWEYSIIDDSWRQIENNSGPSGRSPLTGGFLSEDGIFVCSGGNDGSGAQKDTWIYTLNHYSDGALKSKSVCVPATPRSITLNASLHQPIGTNLTISIRSASDNLSWSNWISSSLDHVLVPQNFTKWGKYFQYNISMNTSDTSKTPKLSDLNLLYSLTVSDGFVESAAINPLEGKVTQALLNISGTGNLDLNITNDNGGNWSHAANNSWLQFAVKDEWLKYRLNLHSNESAITSIQEVNLTYITETYPTNPVLKINGSTAWSTIGEYNNTTQIDITSQLASAQENGTVDGNGNVTIILNLSSSTAGKLKLSDLKIYYSLAPRIKKAFEELSIYEDIEGYGLYNLSDYFIFDNLSGCITYNISFEQNVSALDATLNGTSLDFITVAENWSGKVGFRIKVTDSHGQFVESKTFNITVLPVNDPPVILADVIVVMDEDGTTDNVSILAEQVFDIDNNLSEMTFTKETDDISELNVTITSNGRVVVKPLKDEFGSGTIIYNVSDGNASILGKLNVTVVPVNDPPEIRPIHNITLNEDTVRQPALNLKDFVDDVDNVNSSFTFVKISENQSDAGVNISADGLVNVTPKKDWNGNDTVTFNVSDGNLNVTGNFRVVVGAINDPPIIHPVPDIFLEEDQIISNAYDLRVNITDDDNVATLTITLNSTTAIEAGVTIENGKVQICPLSNWNGRATIFFDVRDYENLTTGQFNVTIRPVNDPPKIKYIPDITVDEDQIIPDAYDLRSKITDEDDDVNNLSITLNSTTAIEAGVTIENGKVQIRPNHNWNGRATITYDVRDYRNLTIGQFNVTVIPINDPPIINTIPNITLDEDSSRKPALDLRDYIDDVDNDVSKLKIMLVKTSNDRAGVSIINGIVNVQPESNWNGNVTVSFEVMDNGSSTFGTFNVTVLSVNDLPTVGNILDITINEDEINLSAKDLRQYLSDADDDFSTLNISLMDTTDSKAGVTILEGIVQIQPEPNWYGNATITFKVSDHESNVTGQFRVIVIPVNDAPLIPNIPDLKALEDTLMVPFDLKTLVKDPDMGDLLVFNLLSVIPNIVGVSISSDGIFRINPIPDWSGAGMVDFEVSDGKVFERGKFTICVFPQNDSPVFRISDQTIQGKDNQVILTVLIPFSQQRMDENKSDCIVDIDNNQSELIIQPLSGNQYIKFIADNGTNKMLILIFPYEKGTYTIKLNLTDGSSQVNATFKVSVNIPIIYINPPIIEPKKDYTSLLAALFLLFFLGTALAFVGRKYLRKKVSEQYPPVDEAVPPSPVDEIYDETPADDEEMRLDEDEVKDETLPAYAEEPENKPREDEENRKPAEDVKETKPPKKVGWTDIEDIDKRLKAIDEKIGKKRR